MTNIIYTKEETKKVLKTLEIISRDLYEIFLSSSLKDMIINVKKEGIENFGIYLDEEGIWINKSIQTRSSRRILCGFNIKKKISMPKEVTKEVLTFINNYEKIRKVAITRAEHILNEKNEQLEIVQGLNRKYQNQVTIELDMPDSLNQNVIEVENIGNKKVGTINFGDHLIRIVTTNDIELVKVDKEEVKQKKK